MIPDYYRENLWDKSILLSQYENTEHLIDYADKLDILLNKIKKDGRIYNAVAIVAPRGMSKMTWGYTVMQTLEEQKRPTVPLLDTFEVFKILQNADKSGGNKYSDFITTPLLMVTTTKGELHKYNFDCIDLLLDKRSRLGLDTIILSRYTLYEMASRDRRRLNNIQEDSTFKNPQRYLSIIQYYPERML